MKIWKYKDKWYASQKVNWESLDCNIEDLSALKKTVEKQFPNVASANGSFLLYVPKVDKCYYAASISKCSSDNKTRFIMSDVYTGMWTWTYPEDVEVVVSVEMPKWLDAYKLQPTHIEWKSTSPTIDKEKYRLQTEFYDLLFNGEVKIEMKRFSIEEYKKNPNRKVVWGLTKQTPVRIICTDCKGRQPIVVLRPVKKELDNIVEYTCYFTASGEYYPNCSEEECLYFAPQKVTKWFVYNTIAENAATKILSTKEEAEKCLAYYNRHGVTHYKVVSFEVEE